MSLLEAVRLELRVALSRHAQPLWFRIVKWTVIVTAAVYFRDARYFWWWVLALFAAAMGLHLLWRAKTKRWTQPWRGWNDVATAQGANRK